MLKAEEVVRFWKNSNSLSVKFVIEDKSAKISCWLRVRQRPVEPTSCTLSFCCLAPSWDWMNCWEFPSASEQICNEVHRYARGYRALTIFLVSMTMHSNFMWWTLLPSSGLYLPWTEFAKQCSRLASVDFESEVNQLWSNAWSSCNFHFPVKLNLFVTFLRASTKINFFSISFLK